MLGNEIQYKDKNINKLKKDNCIEKSLRTKSIRINTSDIDDIINNADNSLYE